MKRLLMICVLMCLFAVSAYAENTISSPADTVRPGRACIISFTLDTKETVSLTLQDDNGDIISTVLSNYSASAGSNSVWWNGTSAGKSAPEGNWRLVLSSTRELAETSIVIGKEVPYFISAKVTDQNVSPSTIPVHFQIVCSTAGTVFGHQKDKETTILQQDVIAGENSFDWILDDFSDGTITMVLYLVDATGETSSEVHIDLNASGFDQSVATEEPEDAVFIETDDYDDHSLISDAMIEEATTNLVSNQSTFTPSWSSPFYGQDKHDNFWTIPMDITDEAAVWAALTADITVIDIGAKSSEKVQAYLRAEPNESSAKVGVVTCETQGVHVLENYPNGWSLVECYSSSFHDTQVQAWNCLVQGYVKTSWLKTITPNQNMGIVIDKLTQRMYIFMNGHLYDTLLVSTGISNKRQPYNETRSGEFITASKVGQISSDNTFGAMAIRYNGGDLIHEVLHTKNKDGSKNYSAAEAKLGYRASHGCIRVQKKTTPNGVNMTWIWKNIKGNSKVRIFIWEDWQGRQVPYPSDETPIFYNPSGGTFYHSADHCSSAKNKVFIEATYADLSGSLSYLKRCQSCTPVMKKNEIDEINAEHAPGGDHDPVLTEARKKYYSMLTKLPDYLDGYYQEK